MGAILAMEAMGTTVDGMVVVACSRMIPTRDKYVFDHVTFHIRRVRVQIVKLIVQGYPSMSGGGQVALEGGASGQVGSSAQYQVGTSSLF